MKSFDKLTKQELANLTEIQVDAYVDLELSAQGINKNVELNIEYPDYVKQNEVEPERDMVVYEVDGYSFLSLEDANSFAKYVGGLNQARVDYEWDIGSEYKYVKNSFTITPTVNIVHVYSEPKYLAIKETLKQIKKSKVKEKEKQDEQVEGVINYEAIDQVKYSIKSKIREAIVFFEKAEKYAAEYDKYFSITEDKDKSINTIFTVYNIQDDEMKSEVIKRIEDYIKNSPKE